MITVTKTAQSKIKKLLEQRGKGAGIRIGIKTSGCSGMSYVLEYMDKYEAETGVTNYGHPDFVVLVNNEHIPYINNMEIDWVRNGLNEGFEFKNPNERDRCGCGESFRV
jgi:iron-sulfur cluster assembly protein